MIPSAAYAPRALGYAIFTQGADMDKLQTMIRDAVRLYFENEDDRPSVIQLHYLQEVVIAA